VSRDNALSTMTAIQQRNDLTQQIRSTILPGWQHMMEQLQRRRSLRSIGRAIGRSCAVRRAAAREVTKTSRHRAISKLFDLWQRECG
jgi:hypothetical protein